MLALMQATPPFPPPTGYALWHPFTCFLCFKRTHMSPQDLSDSQCNAACYRFCRAAVLMEALQGRLWGDQLSFYKLGFDRFEHSQPHLFLLRYCWGFCRIATLREAFENTPKWLGFNIELKYPTEAQLAAMPFRFYSRNYFVDSILKVFTSSQRSPDRYRSEKGGRGEDDLCFPSILTLCR